MGFGKFGHLSRDTQNFARHHGERATHRALSDATFGRGPLANRTGNPFKDNSFFNPWARGGAFDHTSSSSSHRAYDSRDTDPFDTDERIRWKRSHQYEPARHGEAPSEHDLADPSVEPPAARTYTYKPYTPPGYDIAKAAVTATSKLKKDIDASASKAMAEIERGFNESRRRLGLLVIEKHVARRSVGTPAKPYPYYMKIQP